MWAYETIYYVVVFFLFKFLIYSPVKEVSIFLIHALVLGFI